MNAAPSPGIRPPVPPPAPGEAPGSQPPIDNIDHEAEMHEAEYRRLEVASEAAAVGVNSLVRLTTVLDGAGSKLGLGESKDQGYSGRATTATAGYDSPDPESLVSRHRQAGEDVTRQHRPMPWKKIWLGHEDHLGRTQAAEATNRHLGIHEHHHQPHPKTRVGQWWQAHKERREQERNTAEAMVGVGLIADDRPQEAHLRAALDPHHPSETVHSVPRAVSLAAQHVGAAVAHGVNPNSSTQAYEASIPRVRVEDALDRAVAENPGAAPDLVDIQERLEREDKVLASYGRDMYDLAFRNPSDARRAALDKEAATIDRTVDDLRNLTDPTDPLYSADPTRKAELVSDLQNVTLDNYRRLSNLKGRLRQVDAQLAAGGLDAADQARLENDQRILGGQIDTLNGPVIPKLERQIAAETDDDKRAQLERELDAYDDRRRDIVEMESRKRQIGVMLGTELPTRGEAVDYHREFTTIAQRQVAVIAMRGAVDANVDYESLNAEAMRLRRENDAAISRVRQLAAKDTKGAADRELIARNQKRIDEIIARQRSQLRRGDALMPAERKLIPVVVSETMPNPWRAHAATSSAAAAEEYHRQALEEQRRARAPRT